MEERVETRTVFEGKLLKVSVDRVRLGNGQVVTREVVRHPGSVAIVPIDEQGRVVLVRQFRYAIGEELWELPAGTCDHDGEQPETAARRELGEETNLIASRWRRLGDAYLVPGWGDERMTFFLAEGLSATKGQPDPDEAFGVGSFDDKELRELAQSGQLQDAKTLLGLAWTGFQPSPQS